MAHLLSHDAWLLWSVRVITNLIASKVKLKDIEDLWISSVNMERE